MINENKVRIIALEYDGFKIDNSNIKIGEIATVKGYADNEKDSYILEFDRDINGWNAEGNNLKNLWYVRIEMTEKV